MKSSPQRAQPGSDPVKTKMVITPKKSGKELPAVSSVAEKIVYELVMIRGIMIRGKPKRIQITQEKNQEEHPDYQRD